MINIIQLYKDFQGRENTWQGGHAAIKRSFEGWVHEVQIELHNDLIAEYEKSQIVSDNLRFFLKSTSVPINIFATGGLIKYPTDYRYFTGLRFFSKSENGKGCLCSDFDLMNENGECRELEIAEKANYKSSNELCERSITKVDSQRWGSVCNHRLAPPTLKNPYATQDSNGFKVLPKQLGYVVLDYISIPERPLISVTYGEDDSDIFNEAESRHLKWGEEMIPQFLAGIKKRYSAFTRNEAGYIQGEQERINTGI